VSDWFEGREADPDSGLHPLAHALACLAILLEAEAAGMLTDDRSYPGGYLDSVPSLTPHVARLQEKHAEHAAPTHYTRQTHEEITPFDGPLLPLAP